jgi:DNA-binding beta-propeller fold protein YncE
MLFVTGTRRDPDGSTASATVAYVAATGLEVWVKGYDGPGVDGNAEAAALAVAPGGGTLFVTGSGEGKSYHYVTLAYEASTGSRLWLARHRSPNDEDAVSIAVSPDGALVFVTGDNRRSVDFSWWINSVTVTYDAAIGEEIWERGSADDRKVPGFVSSVALGPGGGAVFVTGMRSGPAGSGIDDFTVGFDASSGATLWGSRYGAGSEIDDYAHAMAVSPDGSEVFVTGDSGRRRDYDYVTVAYDASSGTELWARRYQGPGDAWDAASSVAVSPDGSKVFVTGESTGSTANDLDYATIAYAA